jgi:cytochrome P450
MADSLAPRPPRAPGPPLLGSALAMASDPLGFLIEQHRRLGPIFRLRAGHLKLVVLAGEEANAFVHGQGAECFANREAWAPTLRELGAPNNFVGLDGEPHRLLRKTFAAHFSRRAAESQLPALIDLTLRAFAEHRPGDEIPFVAFSQALASRQVGTLLVGRVPSRSEHEAILRYTNAVVVNLSLRRLPRWAFRLSQGPALRRDRRIAFAFARALVEERIESGRDGEPNFVDAVAQASREHPELFAEGEVVSAGLLPFFAGVDTVGQTNVFILYELLRDPALLERVRAEVDSLFEAGPPGPQALRDAPDLNGAVTEAMRMHPVAFAMPRSAARDFSFAGFRVARGESVLVFTSACHFDPACFPDPERFDIDRHRPPRDEYRRPDVFAPWGRGPHQCLGAGFAGVQMSASIATLLYHCDLELTEPEREFPHLLRPSLSLGPEFRLRFRGWRRDPAVSSSSTSRHHDAPPGSGRSE